MNQAKNDLIQNSFKTVGLRQTVKACEAGEVVAVVLAMDADEQLKQRVMDLATRHSIEIMSFPSMSELGELSGIKVGCAVLGILRTSLAPKRTKKKGKTKKADTLKEKQTKANKNKN